MIERRFAISKSSSNPKNAFLSPRIEHDFIAIHRKHWTIRKEINPTTKLFLDLVLKTKLLTWTEDELLDTSECPNGFLQAIVNL